VTLVVDAYLDDRGDMLFDSMVVDPQDGPLQALYWSSRAGEVVPVVHEGQVLEVQPGEFRTVSQAVIEQESDSPIQRPLEDNGDVVFTALFDDGTTGLFVASVAAPEPAAVALDVAALVTLAARARRSRS